MQNFDSLVLQWMDFFNSTIIPFSGMILFSIALIYTVYRSRARVRSSSNSSKRDYGFAISIVTLNFIFFVLNLPIAIYDIVTANITVSHLFDYSMQIIYYLYYAIGFYAQCIVNMEFRNEFLRLLNLRPIGTSGTDMGVTNTFNVI